LRLSEDKLSWREIRSSRDASVTLSHLSVCLRPRHPESPVVSRPPIRLPLPSSYFRQCVVELGWRSRRFPGLLLRYSRALRASTRPLGAASRFVDTWSRAAPFAPSRRKPSRSPSSRPKSGRADEPFGSSPPHRVSLSLLIELRDLSFLFTRPCRLLSLFNLFHDPHRRYTSSLKAYTHGAIQRIIFALCG
jgi:hypothetical protein